VEAGREGLLDIHHHASLRQGADVRMRVQEPLDPVLDLRALDLHERLEIRDAWVAHRPEEEPAERDHGVRATVDQARNRLRVPLVLRADDDLESTERYWRRWHRSHLLRR
jgi:hypothetical protein